MTVSFNGNSPTPPAPKAPPKFGAVYAFTNDFIGRGLHDHFVKVTCEGKIGNAWADDPKCAVVFYDCLAEDNIPRYATGKDKEEYLAHDFKNVKEYDEFTHKIALRTEMQGGSLPSLDGLGERPRRTALQRLLGNPISRDDARVVEPKDDQEIHWSQPSLRHRRRHTPDKPDNDKPVNNE